MAPSFNDFVSTPYPKTCKILQYSGEVEWDVIHYDETVRGRIMYFFWSFAPPKTTILYEEYLIYDTIGLIGSVGGTLGMFIGFSFSNALETLLNNMYSLKTKITQKS